MGLAVAALCLLAFTVPSWAQDDGPRAQLVISDLSGVLGPGSVPRSAVRPSELVLGARELTARLLIENTGSASLDSLRVVTEIHPAVADRSALTAAFDGDVPGQAVHVHEEAVAEGRTIPPEGVRGIEERIGADVVPWDEDGGVHPLRFTLMRGTRVLDDVVTAVVWLQERPETPVTASLVWPLESDPWRTVGGRYAPRADRELVAGGRLDILIAAAAGSRLPVPAPSAPLLEDLGDRADGFEVVEAGNETSRTVPASDEAAARATMALRRLRELADISHHAPVAGTYAEAHLPWLLDGPPALRELAALAAVDSRRRVRLQLGTEVDPATHLVTSTIDRDTLDVLPGDVLLLASASVDLSDDEIRADAVRRLTAPSGRLLTGVVADPGLETALDAFAEASSPVTAVQRILAESAAAALAGETALLLLPPGDFAPSPLAADLLLDRLDAATWLRFDAPGALVRAAGRTGVDTPLAPVTETFPERLRGTLAAALDELAAAEAADAGGDGRISGHTAADLRDTLLRATSRRLLGTAAGTADRLVAEVREHVATSFGEVTIGGGSVTLTSDTGQVPVTLQRSEGEPVVVRVSLDSPGRLRWPEGRTSEPIVLDGQAASTVSFGVEALSTGTFPVTVRVTDPSGSYLIARETISVRSTAFSGAALVGIGAVVVGLLLFGALRRGHRNGDRRLRLVEPGT